MRRAILLSLVVGCGAPARSVTRPSGRCEPARARAGAAWDEVADAAGDGAPARAEATPIDAALERLGQHLSDLRTGPSEVDPQTAMELSSVVMDTIDALGGEVPADLRRRADDAAEALLTDRSAQGSQRASRGAVVTLEAALAAAHPEASVARRDGLAIARLGWRARGAARGYDEDPRVRDRRAGRAETAPLPEAAPEAVIRTRAGAIEASRRARAECRFARSLAVPSL